MNPPGVSRGADILKGPWPGQEHDRRKGPNGGLSQWLAITPSMCQ